MTKDNQKEDEVTVRVYVRGGCTHAIKTSVARGAALFEIAGKSEEE